MKTTTTKTPIPRRIVYAGFKTTTKKMGALSSAIYQRQYAANTPKTRILHGTGIKIRSTETDTKKLFNRFKKWAETYRVTYLQAFCIFYYRLPEFEDHGNEDDYDIARAKLAAFFGGLSSLTINI